MFFIQPFELSFNFYASLLENIVIAILLFHGSIFLSWCMLMEKRWEKCKKDNFE